MTIRVCVRAGVVAAALGFSLAAPPACASKADATAFQIDPAHDGNVKLKKFAAPLKLKWSKELNGTVSYPLIANGMIYVTTSVNPNGGYGTTLYALDQRNGDVVWQQAIEGTYFISNATYDNGQIFVLNFDGQLSAFDATTGAPGVSVHLGDEYDDSGAPVASHGKVYADEEYALYAIDEKNGNLAWTQTGAGWSLPIVSGSNIFTANEPHHRRYSKKGDILWNQETGSTGGAAAYYNGRIYSPGGAVLDGDTGDIVATLGAIGLPAAFWSDASQTDYRMGVSDGKLSSVKAQNGKAAWSFTGDAQLITQPVVINDMVAVGSSAGTLYLLDAASGDVLWSEKVAAGISHEQQGCCTQPWTAIAAGDGELAVPGGDTISVYSPAKKK